MDLNSRMAFQKDAIVRLLQDNDPSTVRLVKDELVRNGPGGLSDLRPLLDHDHPGVALHVREVLGEIENRQAIQEFNLLCQFFPDQGNLEQACWLLARALLPGVDTDHYAHQMDGWGRQLSSLLSETHSALDRVNALASLVSRKLGFHGNTKNYYHIDNALLPTVIDKRCGIPITLSLVYILVARRAGMEVEGVNFPGHFLARHDSVLFDPFHGGRQLEESDCRQLLHRQNLEFSAVYLKSATPKAMLIRILANLGHIFELEDDSERRRLVEAWLGTLTLGS